MVEGIVRPSDGEIQNEEDPAEALPDVEEIRETQAEIKVQAEEEILKTVNESTERGKAALDSLQQDTPDRIRETVIDRIKSVSPFGDLHHTDQDSFPRLPDRPPSASRSSFPRSSPNHPHPLPKVLRARAQDRHRRLERCRSWYHYCR